MKTYFRRTGQRENVFFREFTDHVCGWLGGMIWCVGLAFSLIASGQAGYAISYGLGQGPQ